MFRKFIKWKRYAHFLDKRKRFALQTIILTALLLVTQVVWDEYRFIFIFILGILSYILTVWSLTEDVHGIEWLLLFILPVFYTISVSLFYFLLPSRWIARLSTTIIFAVGTYAVLLIENIYNVAVERSIQLLRVAQSVGLLITLIVVFLSTLILYAMRLPFYFNFLILTPFIFILALQSLWSVRLDKRFSKTLLSYSVIVGLGIGELVLALSFWPIPNTAYALLVTASFYSLVGCIQYHFLGRLFLDSIREYLIVFFSILFISFIITQWGT